MFPLCRKCVEDKAKTKCRHTDLERAITGTWITLVRERVCCERRHFLDPEKITYNPGLRALAKLMLNSFWGKSGKRSDMEKTEMS
ncbi:hypothetical protein HOLleu_42815 [Holothuria leucospilota]|uniref:DNA-directed DNA polymerase n=1 Tax=Holothuria leucospilota TaxID=206669 RepID=A0A9Q0YA66_HOLLE|nr:hypothetical protein HOLleu_42815 [Holothuria leucospilota]